MAQNNKPRSRKRRPVEPKPLPTDPEAAIDIPQAGVVLGLAPITIYQALARGEGPRGFRVGRSIRFRLGDVIAYRDSRAFGKKVAS